jgi:DNA-binding winged helix-turn-helix (wHTH) protein
MRSTLPDDKSMFSQHAPAVHVVEFDCFRIDLTNEALWSCDRRLPLQPKTFAILRYLVSHPGRLVTKSELLDKLWGDVHVSDGALKWHLREIRAALSDDAKAPRFIETVHTRGYRFLAPVTAETVAVPADARIAGSPRPNAPDAPHFVGREAELSRLHACLGRAHDRRVQAAFITGVSGAGKTTLANRFMASLASDPEVLIARGQCAEQYGASEPYMPMLEALERICGGRDREQVVDIFRRRAPSWLSHVPALLDRKEQPLEAGPSRPERMLREMTMALVSLGEVHPLLLLIEDLHWADASTLQLLTYLCRRADSARIMILGTYRPQNLGQYPTGDALQELALCGSSEEIGLTEFDSKLLSRYLAARFPGHRFPPELVPLLERRTNGNPLFSARTVDHWLQRGCFTVRDGAWQLALELAELEQLVPETLSRTLLREIDRLEPLERSVPDEASATALQFDI